MSYPKNNTASDGTTYNTHAAMYGVATPQARAVSQESQGAAYQAQVSTEGQMAAMINQFQGLALPAAGMAGAHMAGTFFTTEQGMIWQPLVYPVTGVPTLNPAEAALYAAGHYHAPAQYPPYHFQYAGGYQMMPFTPLRTGYYAAPEMHKDAPGLDNRRGSYSTTESTPGTPYYGALGPRFENGTYIADRSPLYSTPSPNQALQHQLLTVPVPKLPLRKSGDIPHDIDMDALVKQSPAIPDAIPACFTPKESQHTLEQSLANPIPGNRNVYIRGLHPDTDDEMLAAYAARFGRIETTKAIIDTSTGACKGFGFAKYYDVRHSELCIRGFYRLGYEVGFARESFNSRLKAEADSSSTNLYVSNLPKDWNEQQLGAVFNDYTVLSSRILRDTQGHSRGVGFARFEDRETCEEVIKRFHGQLVGKERSVLQVRFADSKHQKVLKLAKQLLTSQPQVRYADTETQKTLKRVTAERRQFRTNEYNVGAYGGYVNTAPSADGYPSPVYPRLAQVARQFPNQGRHVSQPIHGPNWNRDASSTSHSSAGLGFKVRGQQQGDALNAHFAKFVPTPTAIKVEDPATSEEEESDVESDDEGATIQPTSPIVAHGISSAPSSHKK